jgi:uncharacterized protein
MGLRFDYVFTVKAPAERVWAYLTDPYRVAPALPGAAVTEKVDDRTFKGTITVKVGPVSARYKGTANFGVLDAAARKMEMTGSAQDVSGRGGADMKMSSQLVEKGPAETEVSVATEVNVTGVLAQFGRGMIQDVSNQMFQKFTEAVRVELEKPAEGAPAAAAPPIEVVSFGGQILGQAAARTMRRPGFWIAVGAVVVVLLWWFR